MPHTKEPKSKPQSGLEPTLTHGWRARKADVLTITPRADPLLSIFHRRFTPSELTKNLSEKETEFRKSNSVETGSSLQQQRRLPLLFLGCLTPQQHASVSQGRICSYNFTCCHTEIEVADQTFHLTNHSILRPGQPVPALTCNTRRLAG